MKIKPYGNKILIKALDKKKTKEEQAKEEEEKAKKGKIILLEGTEKESQDYYKAEIIDFGTKIDVGNVGVKKGDTVCVVRYTGIAVDEEEVEDKDYKHFLIELEDIIAAIVKK